MIGALHVDELVHPLRELVPRASNPVRREHRAGGVAANVARSARRRARASADAGREVVLVTALGDDADGEWLRATLRDEGVDCRARRLADRPSGRYTVVHDARGELHLGLADTGIVETLSATSVRAALDELRPAALVLDANLSGDCLGELLGGRPAAPGDDPLAGVPRVAMAVSPDKAARLTGRLGRIELLFCNRREAAALTGLGVDAPLDALSDALGALGTRRLVLSDGAAPLLVRDGERRTRIAVPPVTGALVSVNGAGDALAGATLVQLLAGGDLAAAVRESGLPAAREILLGRRTG